MAPLWPKVLMAEIRERMTTEIREWVLVLPAESAETRRRRAQVDTVTHD